MPPPNFHRMQEELEEVWLAVRTRVHPRTQTILVITLCVLSIFFIGLGLGLSAGSSANSSAIPVYYFLTNHSASCPALSGEKLLTSVAAGESFEGLTVLLQCAGGFTPFPVLVRCQRKKQFQGSEVLEWSGLPVCSPSSLVTAKHWKNTLHARSVSCTGNSEETTCRLQCLLDYVPVEKRPYSCKDLPCRSWKLQSGTSTCFRCDQKCEELRKSKDPSMEDLLATLGCDRDCQGIIVTSRAEAAVWQSKRMGLFSLIGEQGGRPVYQNNATKEFLFFSEKGAEWLVGPDFSSSHGGLQIFGNDDKQCPERSGKGNLTQVYINSGEGGLDGGVGGLWKSDDTLALKCYRKGVTPVEWCNCKQYEIGLKPRRVPVGQPGQRGNHTRSPGEKYMEYLVGKYSRVPAEDSYGLLAPLYLMEEKGLYLFSHHPEGLVWQVSHYLTTSPMRGVSTEPACPESKEISWQWFNVTRADGAQQYVDDSRIMVTCIDQ